jgi:hypothetical protein
MIARFSRVVAFLALMMQASYSCCQESKAQTREEFANAMKRIQHGCRTGTRISEREIIAMLGKPDDIRTRHDASERLPNETKEVWCYGTNGHMTFPTLGCIDINKQGYVERAHVGWGDPPTRNLFEEEELRDLLRLIDTAPIDNASQYNPLSTIQIVNKLHVLGKQKALAATAEYLRIAPDRPSNRSSRVFLVLHVLFEPPARAGRVPNARLTVRSRIVVWEDVPLLMPLPIRFAFVPVFGSSLSTDDPLGEFRKQGHMRAKPLVPTDSPLGLYDVFKKHFPEFSDKNSDSTLAINAKLQVINQLLRLVKPVYHLETDLSGYSFTERKELDARWRKIVTDVGALDAHWDAQRNKYTFKDGSTLPEPLIKLYRREIWKLVEMPGEAEATVERIHKARIYVGIQWSGRRGQKIQPATLRVIVVNSEERRPIEISLAELTKAALEYDFYSAGEYLNVEEGRDVQLELVIGKESKHSPVYKP